MTDDEARQVIDQIVAVHRESLLKALGNLRDGISVIATDHMDEEQVRWHMAGFLEALEAAEGLVKITGGAGHE